MAKFHAPSNGPTNEPVSQAAGSVNRGDTTSATFPSKGELEAFYLNRLDEDARQQAAVELLEAGQPLTPRLLYCVARRRGIDQHRQDRRRRAHLHAAMIHRLSVEPDETSALDRLVDSEALNHRRFLLRRIAKSIKRVHKLDRDIFVRHAIFGEAFAAIASSLGMRTSTVRRRYIAARDFVRNDSI